MCTYMGERYLREQLDSIARQSRLPDELIVCDDNSQDGTTRIIQAFAASVAFPVKLFINDENVGSTLNFSRAISLCEGDIIALSDQDDVWHKVKLELIEKYFLDSQETAAVFSNGNVVDNNLKSLGYTLWDTFQFTKKNRSDFTSGKAFEILLNHNVITGSTMAFRSNLKEGLLPIPLVWVHDAWLAITISTTDKIGFIEKCLIDYRQHENQQIGGLNRNVSSKIQLSKKVMNYAGKITECEALLNYIQHSQICHKECMVLKVRYKIQHLVFRNSIYHSKQIFSYLKVFLELLRGNYHRYSNGLSSACKDLYLISH